MEKSYLAYTVYAGNWISGKYLLDHKTN